MKGFKFMSEFLDREYQHLILTTLAEVFPEMVEMSQYNKLIKAAKSEKQFYGTLIYLENHGLIDSGLQRGIDGHFSMNLGSFEITHKGLDFISEDGGLSAILGVVTVKFDADTLKALIGEKITQSDLVPEEKKKLKSLLQSLPGETIKHLYLKLVDLALVNSPAALPLIQSVLTGQG